MEFFHLLDVKHYFSKSPGIKNWAKRDCLWCEGSEMLCCVKFKIVLSQELPPFSKIHDPKEMAQTVWNAWHLSPYRMWLKSWFPELAKFLAMCYNHERSKWKVSFYLFIWIESSSPEVCFYHLSFFFPYD